MSAIIGDMNQQQGSINVDGKIAYVPSKSWIQSRTLKDNVLFDAPYNEKNYNEVIDACALRDDFENGRLTDKDETECGENVIFKYSFLSSIKLFNLLNIRVLNYRADKKHALILLELFMLIKTFI